MPDFINIKNKQASFEYYLIEKYVAGIQLTGTEIKSIRDGKVVLKDSFCVFINHELFAKNIHISEYVFGTYNNHEPKRDRKLLMNKRELKKMEGKLKDQGITLVPVRLFINDKGLAKLEIALAKGKKLYDKRETLKLKDTKREFERKND